MRSWRHKPKYLYYNGKITSGNLKNGDGMDSVCIKRRVLIEDSPLLETSSRARNLELALRGLYQLT